jgi:hypothetical protein
MRPFVFALQPPRNPLLRLALALVGLVLLGFFTVFGLVATGAVLAGFALRHVLLRLRGPVASPAAPTRPADPHVIEGEFSVVDKPRTPLTSR